MTAGPAPGRSFLLAKKGRFETTNAESDRRPGGRWLNDRYGNGKAFQAARGYSFRRQLRLSAVIWRQRDPLLTVTFSQVPLHARGRGRTKSNCMQSRHCRSAAPAESLHLLQATSDPKTAQRRRFSPLPSAVRCYFFPPSSCAAFQTEALPKPRSRSFGCASGLRPRKAATADREL
jgi:hypothetical protein